MLQSIVDWILYSLVNLDPASRAAQSLNFFIYDSIKIIALLFVMIFLIGFFRSYLPPGKIKQWVTNRRFGSGNLLASTFGAVTPFCSCSSIPLFIGFIEARVPLGVAFSFLITSPIVNEYLVVLMLAFFGWKITALYVISGILIGTIAGNILGRLGLEKYLSKDFNVNKAPKEMQFKNLKARALFGFSEAKSILKKLWLWILVGVGIGAWIHNYIPAEIIQAVVSKAGLGAVPIATALGVPMYGSCAAIVPIAVVLFRKGVPLGTALAFMMATSALSLPEAVILRRVMKLKLIAIFFGVVAAAIILTGYMFNAVQILLF
ncbi:MAG: permease [archaeon]